MDGYEWDGKRWVQQGTARPSPGWAPPPPSAGGGPAGGAFPPLLAGGSAFTDARYGYGLTRQASDDIAFIARYTKVVIIVGLVLACLLFVTQLFTVLSLLGFAVTALPHH